jgi:hypothetical protein
MGVFVRHNDEALERRLVPMKGHHEVGIRRMPATTSQVCGGD